MRPEKKPKRRPYATMEIANFARVLRKLLGIHNRHGTNLLEIFALLQKVFPKLRLRIVANDMLPRGEARAYPASWIIKIRQSVLDGLLRGDFGARWTFAHELGHVLLQHPGRPFRDRSAAADDIEREAHTFAAEFLAPSDHVKKNWSAEKIQATCQISPEAAQKRFDEIASEERRKQFGAKRRPLANRDETLRSENHAAVICTAISATIAENAAGCSVMPFKDNVFSTSILVAKGAQLLSVSYESVYGADELNELTHSSTVAAAILAIRPIRGIGQLNAHETEIVRLNEICAVRAASMLLRANIENFDTRCLSGSATVGPISFPPDYLSELLRIGENRIANSSSILHFFELPTYHDYNLENDISWWEVNATKKIINLFAMIRNAASVQSSEQAQPEGSEAQQVRRVN